MYYTSDKKIIVEKSLLLFFTISLVISCQSDESVDCSTVSCIGPPNLVFEVILNGENVFEEEIYTEQDVSLSGNTPNFENITVRETNLGDRTTQLLYLENSNWDVITYDFILDIANEYTTNLIVEIELSSGSCCGGIPLIKDYQIDGVIQVNHYSVVTLNLN